MRVPTDFLGEVWETMWRHKVRTGLTALSVAWGIFMLVVLLGAGNGLQKGASRAFRDDAVNSIWIRPRKTTMPHEGHAPGRPVKLKLSDHQSVAEEVDGVEHITSRYYVWGNVVVRYRQKNSSFDVRACHPDHRYLEKTIIENGRFLNEDDLTQRRKVAVIGLAVRDFLFEKEDPIGKIISIQDINYRVVGVFQDLGSEREVRKIYIPITTAHLAYGAAGDVHHIMFTIGDATLEKSERMEKTTRALLARRHDFSPEDKGALRVRNNLESYSKIMNIFTIIEIFTWIIGFGTILAGIVGVSNIMLISVKERTKEFGLRKAFGATPASLVRMVLVEAVALTSSAGYLGLLAGVVVLHLSTGWIPEDALIQSPQVHFQAALVALVALILAGGLAGYFPARRAAEVSPVVALRDE